MKRPAFTLVLSPSVLVYVVVNVVLARPSPSKSVVYVDVTVCSGLTVVVYVVVIVLLIPYRPVDVVVLVTIETG